MRRPSAEIAAFGSIDRDRYSLNQRETHARQTRPNEGQPMTIAAATASVQVAAAHSATRTAISAVGDFLTFKLSAEE